ncbi:MobA/MobL family protein, partial [Escherichia coli]|uniref:MobA/MobL family protein n=1 Tax=Escherichia coli TaxID=562 RepID=UPI003EDF08D4
ICWLRDWIFPCSLRYSGAAHCIRGIREKPDENGDDFFRLAAWADHANRALANAGYQEEIDHRSYERQGLEKTPGIHLGKSACA